MNGRLLAADIFDAGRKSSHTFSNSRRNVCYLYGCAILSQKAIRFHHLRSSLATDLQLVSRLIMLRAVAHMIFIAAIKIGCMYAKFAESVLQASPAVGMDGAIIVEPVRLRE